MAEHKIQRTLTAKVVSNKAKDTITVSVERRVPHALYKKIVTKSSKICVHAPNNNCNIGDIVEIEETRPISKTKSWGLIKVIEQAS